MLIDWFTVIAQTVNFLILVWLMKRYLYQPILTAIDAREARIEAELKDAENKVSEAAHERDDFQRKNAEFELRRDALLKTAENDASVERERLADEARKDADALRIKLNSAVQSERDMLGQEVVTHVRNEVFAIARKALTDLATVSIEIRICDVFISLLRTLSDSEKARFFTTAKPSPDTVLVRSAFELPTQKKDEIQLALNEISGIEMPLKFDAASSLICGIELSSNGQKLAWSVDNYLTSLDSQVSVWLANPAPTDITTQITAGTIVTNTPPAVREQVR